MRINVLSVLLFLLVLTVEFSEARQPSVFKAEFINTPYIVKILGLDEEEKEAVYWVDNKYIPRIKELKREIIALYVQLRILTASGKLKVEEFEAIRERILQLERMFWDWLWTYYAAYRNVLDEEKRKEFDKLIYAQLKMYGDPDEILKKMRRYVEEYLGEEGDNSESGNK